MKKVTIAIAWATPTEVWDGEPYARDLGARPTLVKSYDVRACVWLNRGTQKDLDAAKAHALEGGGHVFVYPTAEPDPIGRAKADALRKVTACSS